MTSAISDNFLPLNGLEMFNSVYLAAICIQECVMMMLIQHFFYFIVCTILKILWPHLTVQHVRHLLFL